MSEWKFQKAKDVKPDLADWISELKYFEKKMIKEMYVPLSYMLERKK